jgi:ligand-binding sensor domain-containing protein
MPKKEVRGLLLMLILSSVVAAAHIDVRFQSLTVDDGLSQNSVSVVLQDRLGYLWFGTDDGFDRYDGYSFRTFKRSFHNPGRGLSHNRAFTAWEDPSGRLWIGTLGGGINVLDPATGAIRVYRHDPADPRSLSDDSVRAIVNDSRGRIWIGTDNGLNRFEAKSETFIRYVTSSPGRPATAITSIREETAAGLWLGTRGEGLLHLDPENNTVERLPVASQPGDNPALNIVNTVFIDRDGAFWLGTDAGLVRFDPSRRAFSWRTPGPTRDLFCSRVMTIISDRRGNRWIGTEFGLTLVHAEHDVAKLFASPEPPRVLLSGQFILSVLEDRSGIVWIGSHSGIFKLDPRSQQFHSHRNLLRGNNPGAEPLRILSILEDSQRQLWLGTYKSSLVLWDRQIGTVTQCNTASAGRPGLPGDIITSLY